jgi:aspartyl-tRNA(Asn)/glutamyl-tRNA(Gln) amidotransferase subunit A
LQEKGAKIVDIPPDSLSPGNIRTSLAAYYILASAEASSNLSRYDGLRYGVSSARIDSTAEYTTQLEHQYAATRSLGFGPEVVRRILAGTFVLSSDRFHTHYEAAAKLRAIVTNQLRKTLQSVDVMIIPTSLTLPHEKSFDPTLMFANDVLTVPISLACCPAISIPWRERSPIGIQVVGSDNVTVLEVAGALSLGGR